MDMQLESVDAMGKMKVLDIGGGICDFLSEWLYGGGILKLFLMCAARLSMKFGLICIFVLGA